MTGRPTREEVLAYNRYRRNKKRLAQARYRQVHADTLRTARGVMTALTGSRTPYVVVAAALWAHYVVRRGGSKERGAEEVRKLIRALREFDPR
jgi:hypothetical protein